MKVFLEAIKFNHDPTSATTDALNIRRNETQFVTVPEWRRGISVNPEDSPAAYAINITQGHTLAIKAKFKCSDTSVEAIQVRTVDARNSSSSGLGIAPIVTWLLQPLLDTPMGVLGEVKEKSVPLGDGETDFETLELENVRIWSVGVAVNDIAWRWQFRLDSASPWTDFETSRHRIYTILNNPTLPWRQTPYEITNTQLPWADVLDYACNWASGAKHIDPAATLITRSIYGLGPNIVRYFDEDGASAHYVTCLFGYFNCTLFLERLHGGYGGGSHVNCTDCTVFVSTFANILGCDLWQSIMDEFNHNPIKKIGQSVWRGGFFTYHEVAWKDDCDIGNEVFDACLQVDNDGDPAHSPYKPLLPVNLRFGRPEEGQYRFCLVSSSNSPTAARPIPSRRKRRAISSSDLPQLPSICGRSAEHSKYFLDFESWRGLNRLEESLFVWKFTLSEDIFAGWWPSYIQKIEKAGFPRLIESIWTRPEGYEGDKEVLLRIDLYECDSLHASHDVIAQLLAGFHMPVLARKDSVGDIAFAAPNDVTIIFARANLVLMLRNAGRDNVSLIEIARLLDEIIISKLNALEVEADQTNWQFRLIGTDPFASGDISFDPSSFEPFKGLPLTFKFFSGTGEVFLRNNRLIYRPSSHGLQKIFIYVVNANRAFLRQELRFTVK